MAWLYLILAGLCEVGWPLGFKLANLNPRYHLLFLVLAVVSMGMSGWLLYIAQKTIPMGTAYMIWTGIGGVGTVILGIVFFHDAVTFWRMFFLPVGAGQLSNSLQELGVALALALGATSAGRSCILIQNQHLQ